MAARDIIVIGVSAGGLQALTELCASFPRDLGAAVFVVVRRSPNSPGVLPAILERFGPLPGQYRNFDFFECHLECGSAEETPLFFLRYSHRVPSFRRYGRLVDAFSTSCV
jgi:CheB methylesterase